MDDTRYDHQEYIASGISLFAVRQVVKEITRLSFALAFLLYKYEATRIFLSWPGIVYVRFPGGHDHEKTINMLSVWKHSEHSG